MLNNKKILLSIIVAYFISTVIDWHLPDLLPNFFNYSFLPMVALIFGYLALDKKNKEKIPFGLIFPLLLALIAFEEFIIKDRLISFSNQNLLLFLKKIFEKFYTSLFALTAFSGVIFLLKNHEEKSPKENKLNTQLWQWAKKEGWKYSLPLLTVGAIALGIRVYKIDKAEFRNDEFQVINAAMGHKETGQFYKWDWIKKESALAQGCQKEDDKCHYTRAWPHTWLVAQSFKIFGTSETSARFPSFIFGTLMIFVVYFFTKFFLQSKPFSLLMALYFAFCVQCIDLSRYTRMYAVMIPVFLVTTYSLYRGVTEKNSYRFKNKRISLFVKEYFNFNFYYLLPGLLLLMFNGLFIHRNSLIIVPIFFLFFCVKSLISKEKKYTLGTTLGIIGIILFILLNHSTQIFEFITKYLTFFKQENEAYLTYLVSSPFGKSVGIVLLATFIIYSLLIFAKKRNSPMANKFLFLSILVIFCELFFVYVAARGANPNYISHITPISTVILCYPFFQLINKVRYKTAKISLLLVFALSSGALFYAKFDSLYLGDNKRPKFNQALKVFKENYDPKEDVLFTNYLRSYYFRDYPRKINRINADKRTHGYQYESFIQDLEEYESGWIIWEYQKRINIDRSIRTYACENFLHLHGRCFNEEPLDNTYVEVLYFNNSTNNQLIKK